jgi:hypothetical protein
MFREYVAALDEEIKISVAKLRELPVHCGMQARYARVALPRHTLASKFAFLTLLWRGQQTLLTLAQPDDFVLDAHGDLTILALKLAQFQEFS